MSYNVFGGTLNLAQSIQTVWVHTGVFEQWHFVIQLATMKNITRLRSAGAQAKCKWFAINSVVPLERHESAKTRQTDDVALREPTVLWDTCSE